MAISGDPQRGAGGGPKSTEVEARNGLVELHLGLARHIARSYRHHGSDSEDLNQVALLALVHAADRFDPDLGYKFSSFASATINGEIKRHFRDRVWPVQIPRTAKDLHTRARPVFAELEQALGRQPTPAELATQLGVPAEDIVWAQAAWSTGWTENLDTTIPTADRDAVDQPFDLLPERMLARQLIDELPDLERRVIVLRFFGDLSQDEIARRVGCSQMHISRVITRALTHMRCSS